MKNDPYDNISKNDIPSNKKKQSPIEYVNDGEMWNRLKKIDDAVRKKEQVKPKYGIPPPKRKK